MEINVNDQSAKKVLITETILRDAHQSQAATRMRLDEMIPALTDLDNIGYYSLEAWGGARAESARVSSLCRRSRGEIRGKIH